LSVFEAQNRLLESPSCARYLPQQVDIVTEVDASILGGLQVMVGDRFLDLSVASRVADLSKSLEAAN
jgi:F0F1-type ATP synthase delta subunit